MEMPYLRVLLLVARELRLVLDEALPELPGEDAQELLRPKRLEQLSEIFHKFALSTIGNH